MSHRLRQGGLGVARTFRAVIAFPALLAFVALASCGGDEGASAEGDSKSGAGTETAEASPLFPDNFKGVCSGASVSTATAYDSAATAHKALFFASHEDDLTDRSHSLPGDWTVRFSPEGDALRAVDLVACARRTAAREVKVCDGYQNDGRETQNKVRWHTATYDLSVREARTGRVLSETSVEASDSDCPMFMNFDDDSEVVDAYASLPDTAVADFLRPHITR